MTKQATGNRMTRRDGLIKTWLGIDAVKERAKSFVFDAFGKFVGMRNPRETQENIGSLGYTTVPKEFFQLMRYLSGSETQVLLVIIDKTYGWTNARRTKDEDRIPHSQFVTETGLSKQAVSDALHLLEAKGIITRRKVGDDVRDTYIYSVKYGKGARDTTHDEDF